MLIAIPAAAPVPLRVLIVPIIVLFLPSITETVLSPMLLRILC
jgi:hypothetical protein